MGGLVTLLTTTKTQLLPSDSPHSCVANAFFLCMRNQLHHGSGPIDSGPAIPS